MNLLNVLNLPNQSCAKDAKKKNHLAVVNHPLQLNYVINVNTQLLSVYVLKKIAARNAIELLVFVAKNALTFHALVHHPHAQDAPNLLAAVKPQNQ